MQATKQTAKVLSGVIKLHEWTQSDLAKLSGIAIPTVSHHITGQRVIRDDHLSAYCRCLDPIEKEHLVSAWLQDVLDPDDVSDVLESGSMRLREDVRTWGPGLTERQRQQLDFWSAKLAKDDELDDVFDIISRKAGWTPN